MIPDIELPNKYKELIDRLISWLDDLPNRQKVDGPEYLSEEEITKGTSLVDNMKLTRSSDSTKRARKKSKHRHLFYLVFSKSFKAELLGLEAKLGRGKCYNIAVFYSKAGQSSIEDMRKNRNQFFKMFIQKIYTDFFQNHHQISKDL